MAVQQRRLFELQMRRVLNCNDPDCFSEKSVCVAERAALFFEQVVDRPFLNLVKQRPDKFKLKQIPGNCWMQKMPNFSLNLLEFIHEQVRDTKQKSTRDPLDIQVLKWAFQMLTSGRVLEQLQDFSIFCGIDLQLPSNNQLFQSELKFIDQFQYIAQPEEVNVQFSRRFGDGSFPIFKAAQIAKYNVNSSKLKQILESRIESQEYRTLPETVLADVIEQQQALLAEQEHSKQPKQIQVKQDATEVCTAQTHIAVQQNETCLNQETSPAEKQNNGIDINSPADNRVKTSNLELRDTREAERTCSQQVTQRINSKQITVDKLADELKPRTRSATNRVMQQQDISRDIESGDDEEDEDLLAEVNNDTMEQNNQSGNYLEKDEDIDTDIPPECQLNSNFDIQIVEGEDCVNNVPQNNEWANDDERRYDEFANDFIEEGNRIEREQSAGAINPADINQGDLDNTSAQSIVNTQQHAPQQDSQEHYLCLPPNEDMEENYDQAEYQNGEVCEQPAYIEEYDQQQQPCENEISDIEKRLYELFGPHYDESRQFLRYVDDVPYAQIDIDDPQFCSVFLANRQSSGDVETDIQQCIEIFSEYAPVAGQLLQQAMDEGGPEQVIDTGRTLIMTSQLQFCYKYGRMPECVLEAVLDQTQPEQIEGADPQVIEELNNLSQELLRQQVERTEEYNQ